MSVQPGPGSADVSVPDALPVLPLRDAVVFPLTVVPLAVDEPRSIRLIDEVMRGNRLLALVARREAKPEPAVPDDLYRMGTVGMIHQLARVPDGSVRLIPKDTPEATRSAATFRCPDQPSRSWCRC